MTAADEFAELDAACHAKDRRLIIAASLGFCLESMAAVEPGLLQQMGWNLAVRYIAKTRRYLLMDAQQRPIETLRK